MIDANPGMRELMSNPDMMRGMFDPANVRAMQQMAQAAQQLQQGPLGSLLGAGAAQPGKHGGCACQQHRGARLHLLRGAAGKGGGCRCPQRLTRPSVRPSQAARAASPTLEH